MIPDIPVFDFHNPWVAILALVLTYVLPRLVGLVSDKLASGFKKGALLGVLSVVAAALTFLLDVATVNGWATLVWTDLVNVVVNAAIVWVISQQMFDRIIKPSGQAEYDAEHGLSLIKADSRQPVE